ncbi:MAG TPA: endonuclease V [Candidatus Binatia bacterium]|nr:endonuclease V [Candidatus Binatia bacterium]
MVPSRPHKEAGIPTHPALDAADLAWIVWPETKAEMEQLQRRLAATAAREPPWVPPEAGELTVGAVFCAHRRGGGGPGTAGEPAWIGAVVLRGDRLVAQATVRTETGGPYAPGLLGLREGPALEAGARALCLVPDVLLVDATGRDHPRGCGLALHLGARLGIPTVGVTDRPLLAGGPEPERRAGVATELRLEGDLVGYLLRSSAGGRPITVHAAWRTTPELALSVVRASLLGQRTPEALRWARSTARAARSREG